VTKFRVWNEVGDLLGEHDNAEAANDQITMERAACPCDEDGEFACGVMFPHGIHLQVSENGWDITNTYYDSQL
jgi:hypothetical protein